MLHLLTFILLLVMIPLGQDSGYRVVDVIDLGRMSGPTQTAAFLSPDGSYYIHFEGEMLCLYRLPENEEEACYQLDERIRPDLETGRWSPNGQYFAFVDNPSVRFAIDSDIQMLDIAAGEIRNITDDGYDGRIIINPQTEDPYTVDIAVGWSDDNQLAILRYVIPDRESRATVASIDVVDPVTGEIQPLLEREVATPFLYYTLDWSNDVIALGEYSVDFESDWSIDLFDAETGDLVQEITVAEELRYTSMLQFSADSAYLIAYNPAFRAQYSFSTEQNIPDGMMVIDLATNNASNLDEERYVIQAGFAPDGNAIAYIVQNPLEPENAGLYIAPAIGEQAELVYQIPRADATTPEARIALTWASDNTILIRDNETWNAMLIVLEENE